MHIYAIFDKELLQDKGAEYAADLAGAKEILKTMHRTLVEQNDGAHHADLCIALIRTPEKPRPSGRGGRGRHRRGRGVYTYAILRVNGCEARLPISVLSNA